MRGMYPGMGQMSSTGVDDGRAYSHARHLIFKCVTSRRFTSKITHLINCYKRANNLPGLKDQGSFSWNLCVSSAAYIHWWYERSISASIQWDEVPADWSHMMTTWWTLASGRSRMLRCPQKTRSSASADHLESGSSVPLSTQHHTSFTVYNLDCQLLASLP